MGKKDITAIIDIGSHAISLKLCEKNKGKIRILEYLSHPLWIGRDTFNDGKISFEKAHRACEILRNYSKVAGEYGADSIRAVATSAIREASNRDYVLDQIRIKTGLRVEVIDNKEEKFYIYKTMLSKLEMEQKQNAMMVHIGSGNIGVSILDRCKIVFTQNIGVGSLRISELFEELHDYSRDFHTVLEDYLNSFTDYMEGRLSPKIPYFIATGSGIAIIAELCGWDKRGDLLYISRDGFSKLYNEIKYKTVNRIIEDYNISPDDAETLIPSMCIYNNLLYMTGSDFIIAPFIDLTDALILEELLPEEFQALNSDMSQSAVLSSRAAALRFGGKEEHYIRVESYSLMIFDKIKKIHGMGKEERLLLQCAAILHDIGKFVSLKEHYRHSYNIIRYLEIPGLSIQDMELIANISLYHSRAVPTMEDENYRILSPEERVKVSKLAAILRIADALDRSHVQKFAAAEAKMSAEGLTITVETDTNIELEQWSFKDKGKFFEEVYGITCSLRKKKVT